MTAVLSTHFQRFFRRFLTGSIVFLSILGLYSCQYFPKVESPIDAETKSYQGRIAFKSPAQSFAVVFKWSETNSRFQLTLRDRFALGGVRIQGDESSVQIEYSNGEVEENIDLDTWIVDNLGVSVPFLELWKCLSLSCTLIDDAEQKTFDRWGRIETFTTNHWKFTLTYKNNEPATPILKKLELGQDTTEINVFFTKFEN